MTAAAPGMSAPRRSLLGVIDEAFDVEDQPHRAAWLARRRTGIASTDALVLACEREARDTRYALWARKSGLLLDDDSPGNRFTEWGNRAEPIVLKWWADETGIRASRRPFRILRRRDAPHLISSPDALAWEEREGVEAKTCDSRFAEEWEDGVPLRHVVQCQHQLLVTGWARWHVAVLIGGNDARRFVIERDEAFISALRAEADAFWRRVLDDDPPPMTGRPPEGDVLRAMFPAEQPGARVVLPPEAIELHEQRVRAERMIKLAESLRDEATIRLEAMLGPAEVGTLPDGSGRAYTLRTERRKAYIAQHPARSGRVLRFQAKPTKRRQRA